jgi:hypothetical protein
MREKVVFDAMQPNMPSLRRQLISFFPRLTFQQRDLAAAIIRSPAARQQR